MLKKNYLLATLLTFALIPFMFFSCDDDDDVVNSSVSLSFNQTIDGQAVQLGQNYSINGTSVSFDRIQYYVSQIEIVDASSSATLIPESYFLFDPTTPTYDLGQLSTDRIQSLRFNVGIDSAANNISETDFASYPSESPLAAKDPSMHWNWNSGYKFFVLEGKTDADGDGTPEQGFVFHIGSDPLLRQVEISTAKDLGQTQETLNFTLQLEEVLSNVDMATEFDTHTANNFDLANRIANNLLTAFSIE